MYKRQGEQLVIYHTGDEKSAVGTASVVSVDASEAKNPQVKIKAGKPLAKPVTLAQVKANKLFADSPLVRQGRLSVVPLTDAQYKFCLLYTSTRCAPPAGAVDRPVRAQGSQAPTRMDAFHVQIRVQSLP